MHASGDVNLFVGQVLSFSVLFISSLSSLEPNSDYVGVNTSPNNFFLLSFLFRSLTRSCFLLLLFGRLFLLAFPHHLGTCLSSLWSPPFPLHAPALILSLSCQGVALAHLDSLLTYDLVLLTDSGYFLFWQ